MTAMKLLILPGDGIGPEVMSEVAKIIDWLGAERGLNFDVETDLVGGAAYDAHGKPLSDETMAKAQAADAVLLVGSNIRHEAPILGHRVRKAALAGGRVLAVNPLDWNFHFDLAGSLIAAPQHLVAELASVARAVAEASGTAVPEALSGVVNAADVNEVHRGFAGLLNDSERGVVLVGQFANAHPQASWLRALSAFIASASGGKLNVLPHGANTRGAEAAGALPVGGMNAAAMLMKNITMV